MEVNHENTTFVGVICAAIFACAALIMKNNEMAVLGMTVVATAIGGSTLKNKLGTSDTGTNTTTDDTNVNTEQATNEEQATPVDTKELAAQAGNTDSSGSATGNNDSQGNAGVTGTAPLQITLSDASVQALASAINTQNQQNTENPQTQ